MKTINYLHTAVILSALLISAMCTSQQSILGAKEKNASSVPVSRGISVDEEKKEIIPQSALEQKSGILSMPQNVTGLIFGNLSLRDKMSVSLVHKRLNEDVNKHIQTTKIKELYDIYESKEKDYSSFFSKPDAHAIKLLANGQDKKARRIKHDFMRHYWQYLSKQNKETRNKILLSLPRSLLLHGHAMGYMLYERRDNILYFIRESIGLDPQDELPFTADDLWNNEVFVRAIVQKNGYALQNASARLRKKKEIVLLAVKSRGLALEYASGGLEEDEDVVNAAVTQCGTAIAYASLRWQRDYTMAIKALKQHYKTPEEILPELWKKPAFARLVIEQCPNYADFFHLFSTTIRNDPEIKELQTKRDSTALKHTARLVLHLPFR